MIPERLLLIGEGQVLKERGHDPGARYTVFLPAPDQRTFRLTRTAIEVQDKDGVALHSARPHLIGTIGTDCQIEGATESPMRLWEFSRLALGPLFFQGR